MRAFAGVCALAALVGGLAATPENGPTLSDTTTGGPFVYRVQPNDTIAALSSRFGIDRAVLARENGLTANARLVIGQPLALDNRHIVPAVRDAEILVNVPQRMLFHRAHGFATSGYPIAVGQPDWPTPRGAFEVVAKEENPTWDVPRSIQEEMRRSGQRVLTRVPPGPANPLGRYWLGLSLPGIGIHGTSAPLSVYRPVTHGCLRLNPEAAQELFLKVEIGAAGRILYEPVLLALVDGAVFLEAHPDVYGLSSGGMLPAIASTLEAAGLHESIDWTAVRVVLNRRDGIARAIEESARTP